MKHWHVLFPDGSTLSHGFLESAQAYALLDKFPASRDRGAYVDKCVKRNCRVFAPPKGGKVGQRVR